MFEARREKCDFDLRSVDEAMLQFETLEIRTSFGDLCEDRGTDGFVVHAVSLIEEPTDRNSSRFFVEIFEKLSEFCD